MGSGATPFWAGGATPSSTFAVTSSGSMKATSANITGTITSTSGSIGGFTIGSSTLTAGTGSNSIGISTGISTSGNVLYAGNSATPSVAPFRVSNDGTLTAASFRLERDDTNQIVSQLNIGDITGVGLTSPYLEFITPGAVATSENSALTWTSNTGKTTLTTQIIAARKDRSAAYGYETGFRTFVSGTTDALDQYYTEIIAQRSTPHSQYARVSAESGQYSGGDIPIASLYASSGDSPGGIGSLNVQPKYINMSTSSSIYTASIQLDAANELITIDRDLDVVGVLAVGSMDNLRLTSTTDASLSSTAHAFQIGDTSGFNLIVDNNEIMARNNGAASSLILNGDGGSVSISSAKLVILDTGKLGVGGSPTYYLDVTTSGGRLALDSTASTNVTLGTGNNAHTIRISGGIPDAASDGGAIQLYGNAHSTQASKIIFDTDGTEITRFNATGEILIGKTTDAGAYLLQVNSQIWATNATVATSDERLKENIEPLSDGLEAILSLRPVTFEWKEQQDIIGSTGKILEKKFNFPEGKQIGFIAQDVEKALKDKEWVDSIVTCDSLAPVYDIILDEDGEEVFSGQSLREQDTIYGVAEGHIIPLLVKAVQELSKKVDELQDKLDK